MPARVFHNNGESKIPEKAPKVQVQAPVVNNKREDEIKQEMEAFLVEANKTTTKTSKLPNNTSKNSEIFSNLERAKFYAGHDRLDLQGQSVQRVRQLQEENDHLQREIAIKEKEVVECEDPLAILADIEHRRVIIARNTGEILKIYLRNEERIKRLKELETTNSRIQSEMMEMQGRFISTKNMEEKTKFASEFFILKAEIERNISEIADLSKN